VLSPKKGEKIKGFWEALKKNGAQKTPNKKKIKGQNITIENPGKRV